MLQYLETNNKKDKKKLFKLNEIDKNIYVELCWE